MRQQDSYHQLTHAHTPCNERCQSVELGGATSSLKSGQYIHPYNLHTLRFSPFHISPKTFIIITLTGNKTTISYRTYDSAAPHPPFPEYLIPYPLSVDGFHSFRATKMQWVKKTNYLIKPLQWKQEDFCKKTKEWGNPGIEPGTTRNFAVRQRSEASLPGLLPKRVSYP